MGGAIRQPSLGPWPSFRRDPSPVGILVRQLPSALLPDRDVGTRSAAARHL